MLKWRVVVTTAPREESTLRPCLHSLVAAGWKPDCITVCAEPDSQLTSGFEYIVHTKKLGLWHNWLFSARHALLSDASVIMTVQDDALFHPDSKELAESLLWPSKDTGILSLYTAKHYSRHALYAGDAPGMFQRVNTQGLWGALAWVFPPPRLQEIITHRIAKSWQGFNNKQRGSDIVNLDSAVGKILNALELQLWLLHPSPVKHIAKHSTVGQGSNLGRRNCYGCADHTKPLRPQIFPQHVDHNELRRLEAIERLAGR